MRPPEFTGGNGRRRRHEDHHLHEASMRPPEFTGGNRYHTSSKGALMSLLQ